MAITSAICNSYKQEVLQGVHEAGDTYMIALYTSSATMGATTTVYSTSNEVVGTGYTAGGMALTGFTTGLDTGVAYIDWTTDPAWTTATITARGCLIYNATQSNKAVVVLDFGADVSSSAGTFTVTLPAATGTTAVVRLA